MWELDYKESWAPKNWCFWTVVLEKTLESPLDCKEIQPVHPKWIFRTDGEAETPILWPPDGKNWFIWKDPDVGKDLRQEKKGMTENEMEIASPTQRTWVWASSEMNREVWRAAVHRAQSPTWLSYWTTKVWWAQFTLLVLKQQFLNFLFSLYSRLLRSPKSFNVGISVNIYVRNENWEKCLNYNNPHSMLTCDAWQCLKVLQVSSFLV